MRPPRPSARGWVSLLGAFGDVGHCGSGGGEEGFVGRFKLRLRFDRPVQRRWRGRSARGFGLSRFGRFCGGGGGGGSRRCNMGLLVGQCLRTGSLLQLRRQLRNRHVIRFLLLFRHPCASVIFRLIPSGAGERGRFSISPSIGSTAGMVGAVPTLSVGYISAADGYSAGGSTASWVCVSVFSPTASRYSSNDRPCLSSMSKLASLMGMARTPSGRRKLRDMTLR